MFTKFGNVVNFEKNEVPLQGRVSGGVKGVNLEDKDCVVYAGQNVADDYMIVTANGYVKRLAAIQIPICARYRKGVKYINFAGNCKVVAFVTPSDSCVVDQGLKFVELQSKKFKVSNDRLSVGEEEIKKKFLGIYVQGQL